MAIKLIICYVASLLTLFSLCIPLSTWAEGGSELAVTGTVVASPCTIAPDTIKGDVDLGKVFTNSLHIAGDSTSWVNFSLNLNECPPTTTKVVVHFTGEPDPDYPVYFNNTGTSKNAVIEVADDAGGRISNTSVRNLTVNSQHQAKIDLRGRMVSPKGDTTAGSVSGLMELAFDFQ